MATGESVKKHQREVEEQPESEPFDCTDDSDSDSGDDSGGDSGDDTDFDVIEETRCALSEISINKRKARKCIEGVETEIPKLDLKDEKTFEKVEELIKGGDLEKLKVDQCKIYLRKYGLRLTGKKDVLISRIIEHREISDGCGEKKYPPESFVLNCKGDACLGDVVMFEQNVYDMFSIVSRSATGPSCGTRTVAGRIVKESYGAAKQQHTFTVEVLWSKGMKPWPPLHPLLIKGRNLYRIKTMRQRWIDEGERRKVLQEKHARGFCARSSRDVRIQEKERRKNGMKISRTSSTKNSIADKENHHPQTSRIHQVRNSNKEQHQQEMRSNANNLSTFQQIGNVAISQQPLPSILGKPRTAEHDKVSEYGHRTHVGTSQAQNSLSFGYFRHNDLRHHTYHPNPANHYYHHHHHMPRTLYPNPFIHPAQLYPRYQNKQ